jgi:hypothetical protein
MTLDKKLFFKKDDKGRTRIKDFDEIPEDIINQLSEDGKIQLKRSIEGIQNKESIKYGVDDLFNEMGITVMDEEPERPIQKEKGYSEKLHEINNKPIDTSYKGLKINNHNIHILKETVDLAYKKQEWTNSEKKWFIKMLQTSYGYNGEEWQHYLYEGNIEVFNIRQPSKYPVIVYNLKNKCIDMYRAIGINICGTLKPDKLIHDEFNEYSFPNVQRLLRLYGSKLIQLSEVFRKTTLGDIF